ncbi:AAA family ATPase [Armatimonas rosea]|uniref:ATPase dynein-related AAA domain-containing protein n=1 Tax=Armatimonas rosea TaxID=685828 RepID=A0A7W9SWV6_ARMRO|nr:AAA family ATPase [Armatimonas rosea]MBB6053888.1 hypothetical protein [Armatimonas rosea]
MGQRNVETTTHVSLSSTDISSDNTNGGDDLPVSSISEAKINSPGQNMSKGVAFSPPKTFQDAVIRLNQAHQEINRLKADLANAHEMEDLYEAERKKLEAQETQLNEERANFATECQQAVDAAREAAIAEVRQEIYASEEQLRREWFEEKQAAIQRDADEQNRISLENIAEAEAKAKSIREQAEVTGRDIVDAARARAAEAMTEREQELSTWEERLIAEESRQKTRQRELKDAAENLQWERDDLEADRMQVNQLRVQTVARWEQCSPDIVADLKRRLKDEQGNVTRLEESLRETRTEADELREKMQGGDGRSLTNLLEERDRLKERCKYLSQRLSELPDEEEASYLREAEQENARFHRENAALRRQVIEEKNLAARREVASHELSALQAQVASYRAIVDQLEEALRRHAEAHQRTGEARFPELLNLDEKAHSQETGRPARLTAPIGKLLPTIVKLVRDFGAAQKRPLYYREATVRSFLAGMAASPLAILQGVSGTGKSSLPQIFAEAMSGTCSMIPVQSSWRDRHDLLGYNNDFTGRFSESALTRALYEAQLHKERENLWFIVLDEMNLARIEYYFADFLSEMEKRNADDRAVDLISFDPRSKGEKTPEYLLDGRRLRLPRNVWFVGTANRDESTLEITDKVYDRAQVIDFQERENPFQASSPGASWVSYSMLTGAFNEAIGAMPFLPQPVQKAVDQLDDFLQKEFGITFGFRLQDQLCRFAAVYSASGGTVEEAVDIQIARKVLRKLESLLDPEIRKPLEEVQLLLESSALAAGAPEPLRYCKAVIQRRIAELSGGRI